MKWTEKREVRTNGCLWHAALEFVSEYPIPKHLHYVNMYMRIRYFSFHFFSIELSATRFFFAVTDWWHCSSRSRVRSRSSCSCSCRSRGIGVEADHGIMRNIVISIIVAVVWIIVGCARGDQNHPCELTSSFGHH